MTDPDESVSKYATGLRRMLGWLAFGLLPIQQTVAGEMPAPPPTPSVTAAFESAPMNLCAVASDGFLSGDLFGALSEHIDWRGGNMDCGGMLRPDNDDGIRLVFAAPRQGQRLLIVLGIDGELDELLEGEHSTNITIIDETRNRFFSAGRKNRCWSTIESIRPVADHSTRILQVVGEVYCYGSLPSLSDNSSVALRDVSYSGRLLLDESDPG